MACIYLLLTEPPKMTANDEAIIINVCIAAECIAAVHQEFIILFFDVYTERCKYC